jgi:hypothetical protein
MTAVEAIDLCRCPVRHARIRPASWREDRPGRWIYAEFWPWNNTVLMEFGPGLLVPQVVVGVRLNDLMGEWEVMEDGHDEA